MNTTLATGRNSLDRKHRWQRGFIAGLAVAAAIIMAAVVSSTHASESHPLTTTTTFEAHAVDNAKVADFPPYLITPALQQLQVDARIADFPPYLITPALQQLAVDPSHARIADFPPYLIAPALHQLEVGVGAGPAARET